MKNSSFEKLTRAIDGHQVILLRDDAGLRIVEPYLIYESAAGDLLLHGRQIDGIHPSGTLPKWINLQLEDITWLETGPEQFVRPPADYNPRSPGFHRIVYEIDVKGRRPHRHPTSSRLPRLKRRPPPKAGMMSRGNGGGKRRQRSS